MIWHGSNRPFGDNIPYAPYTDFEDGGGGGGRSAITVATDIRRRRERSEWASGEALPTGALADEYNVSRSTVRRAMHRLAEAELVKIIPGLGPFKA